MPIIGQLISAIHWWALCLSLSNQSISREKKKIASHSLCTAPIKSLRISNHKSAQYWGRGTKLLHFDRVLLPSSVMCAGESVCLQFAFSCCCTSSWLLGTDRICISIKSGHLNCCPLRRGGRWGLRRVVMLQAAKKIKECVKRSKEWTRAGAHLCCCQLIVRHTWKANMSPYTSW